ncbi:maltose transport system permease protein MalF [mine drainage metagenome]|uniref:Maltose transport system permease protein MalF n=1 Tax=mine drainage metagenome TaxID=410659 RepID=A0A1J5QM72_9ZZZZ
MKLILTRLVAFAAINGVGLWSITTLFTLKQWIAMSVVAVLTLLVDFVYLSRKTLASRYLLPGTIFLVLFQIYPVFYTAYTAFTNYSVGHMVTRDEAIQGVIRSYVQPLATGGDFNLTVVHKGDTLGLLLTNTDSKKVYLGTSSGLSAVSNATLDQDGNAIAIPGWQSYQTKDLMDPVLQKRVTSFEVPVSGSSYISADSTSTAIEQVSTVKYDQVRNRLVDSSTGYVFPERSGNFIAPDGTRIDPGWRVNVGTKNFVSVLTDKRISGPFFRVFVWTFVWAGLSVLTTFAMGLALALTLNKKMKGQRIYRSLLVIPYAMPAFLSVLIWGGLLNDDYGLINRTFGSHIPWLFDPFWAKISVLMVNLWLGFPYMFLVTTGALQSIPAEFSEAAAIDGANAWQVFRRINLPLLMVSISPLLIASFAYNFNNFGSIYLLTGGGPAMNGSDVAGATDILISYTYKLAFAVGKGENYGIASTVSIFIFVIVASISAISFRRTRALENMN